MLLRYDHKDVISKLDFAITGQYVNLWDENPVQLTWGASNDIVSSACRQDRYPLLSHCQRQDSPVLNHRVANLTVEVSEKCSLLENDFSTYMSIVRDSIAHRLAHRWERYVLYGSFRDEVNSDKGVLTANGTKVVRCRQMDRYPEELFNVMMARLPEAYRRLDNYWYMSTATEPYLPPVSKENLSLDKEGRRDLLINRPIIYSKWINAPLHERFNVVLSDFGTAYKLYSCSSNSTYQRHVKDGRIHIILTFNVGGSVEVPEAIMLLKHKET